MFGERISYEIHNGPSTEELISAMLAHTQESGCPDLHFTMTEDPWIDMDVKFSNVPTEFFRLTRPDPAGTEWQIDAFFQPTYSQAVGRRLAGTYDSKSRTGLMKEPDSE